MEKSKKPIFMISLLFSVNVFIVPLIWYFQGYKKQYEINIFFLILMIASTIVAILNNKLGKSFAKFSLPIFIISTIILYYFIGDSKITIF